MYMRPQLSRRRTGDREILSKEHNTDVATYKQSLEVGKDYDGDTAKVAMMIDAISQNDSVADEDKKPILDQLNQLFCELQKEYSTQVGNELADIEFSMEDRIDEIEAATRFQESEVFRAETTTWHTATVDKHKLVAESMELLHKYQALLGKSKSDLYQLMKEADEQRQRIREHRTKR